MQHTGHVWIVSNFQPPCPWYQCGVSTSNVRKDNLSTNPVSHSNQIWTHNIQSSSEWYQQKEPLHPPWNSPSSNILMYYRRIHTTVKKYQQTSSHSSSLLLWSNKIVHSRNHNHNSPSWFLKEYFRWSDSSDDTRLCYLQQCATVSAHGSEVRNKQMSRKIFVNICRQLSDKCPG